MGHWIAGKFSAKKEKAGSEEILDAEARANKITVTDNKAWETSRSGRSTLRSGLVPRRKKRFGLGGNGGCASEG